MQNFVLQIQTPLSWKQNKFDQFFIAFQEMLSNFEHSEKKDEFPSISISKIIDSKRDGT